MLRAIASGVQMKGRDQLLISPGMNELRLAVALERVDGDDPFPAVRFHFVSIPIEDLEQILPDVSIVLLCQNQPLAGIV